MMISQVKHEFGPIINSDSQILILGSMPSVSSRKGSFYYLHPMNRFWTVLSAIYQLDFVNADINQKRELLLKCHVALYDVIESCQINGSSDSSISNVYPIDLEQLFRIAPIHKIFLNGSKAFTLFKKYFPNRLSIAFPLLSTSPANAKFSLTDLVNQWRIIKCQ
ncbi:MAG: DNA-deoxyinosine glycosylase [Candidatus Izemoplasmatales bacterium]|jgi:hypoxanthine-DNA glycosylase|nr:DNA-deoxyinosine glycosylase [Candidatus Izemoplasmatales bacterium]MDD3865755.1 DNA-deoxyinosine glycosylase [Candidatus Izemoplasmatales bacterium]